jgi:hypothetical protein
MAQDIGRTDEWPRISDSIFDSDLRLCGVALTAAHDPWRQLKTKKAGRGSSLFATAHRSAFTS